MSRIVKRFYLFLLICIFVITGCNAKKTKLDLKSVKSEIEEYVKKSIEYNWTYSEEKLIIDDDLNVEIKLFNVDDFIYCFDSSKEFAKKLKENYSKDLKINALSFICEVGNTGTKSGMIKIDNIQDIDMNNYEDGIKIFDENENLISKNVDEYREEYKKRYISQCKSYNYKDIFRNSEEYIRKYAKFTGEVIQVMEENNNYYIRINVTKNNYGYYEDTIMAYMPTDVMKGRILEDDILTIYGVLGELTSYESIFGEVITIPSIGVRYVELINN